MTTREVQRLVAIGALALQLLASSAIASTIVVPDEMGLQAALTAAVNHDTLLIRAGYYVGPFSFSGKDLTILGESGAAATILDGQDLVRVLEIGAGTTMDTRVEGLTFARGRASEGAGVKLATGSGVTVVDCRFTRNVAVGFHGGPGGGFFMIGGQAKFNGCAFEENSGSAASVFAQGSLLEIRHSLFRANTGERMGLWAQNVGNLIVESNVYVDNDGLTNGGIIAIEGCSGVVRSNTIAFNDAAGGSGAFGAIDVIATSPILVERNIVAGNTGAGVVPNEAVPGSLTFTCNDVWNNSLGDIEPGYAIDPSNLSADPQFCHPDTRDLTIENTSPCAPAQQPTCGLIGRYDVGCNVVSVVPSTWSRIKRLGG